MKNEKLSNEYIHVYELNKSGRDFVVADIHGNYNEFMLCLEHLNFDFSKDRIFSLGDIVDRGSNDVKAMSLLDEPWFNAIMGNHEAMIVESYYDNAYANGNAWASQIYYTEGHPDKQKLIHFTEKAKNLPFIFDIRDSESDKRWLCAHAEVPSLCFKNENVSFDALMEDADSRYYTELFLRECNVIWGRYQLHFDDYFPQVDWVFHGHTIMPNAIKKGNRLYMDQGFFQGYQNWISRNTPWNATLNFVELGSKYEILYSVSVVFCENPYVDKNSSFSIALEYNGINE